ncbi:low molecular weight protein-tyrosine-phosphatase [Nocardioides lentus]|uniref:protein-tyrosine-phosphatase n=1 Tax=Nocardioides lentus TaxID=338077 RepID=A0ABP5A9I4_9ACTN
MAVVCLGNICRSPIAGVVLRDRVAGAGLADVVTVTSGGTGGWHVGGEMDARAAATLDAAGYDADDVAGHRARQYDAGWAAEADLVLAMDAGNLAEVRRRAEAAGTAEPGRLRLFRDLDDVDPGADVPDPYYGGDDGFEEVLGMVERTADRLVAALPDALDGDRSGGRA